MSTRVLMLLAVVLAGRFAPAADGVGVDPAGVEFFERRIRPLLVQHCAECHDGGHHEGGLSLTSRGALLKGGDSGPAVVPGDPEKSRLIEALRYRNLDLQMPPKGALSPEEVAAFEKWVAHGAPDPREETASGAPRPTGMSLEAGREFWSLKPISAPAVPAVARPDWVRTPVDAFVLRQLADHGLTPAPPADRRTLLRRMTFDLTGLPPTPEELEAFVNDERADALERVVERLLASPQYGVRWGRHWLDVARYADSNGLDENLAYGNAWRYRDYVVNAFNSDKPFDRFLMEQIAGDLLPDADVETRTATGFLSLGAKVLAEPDREKLTMDTIDEQIDATGKAFLGLTLGCVRCHDHKFDPIKQSDYYGLAAIFKSTRTFADTNTGAIKHWFEHEFGDDAEKQSLKTVEAAIKEKQKAATSFKATAMAKVREAARAHAVDYLVAAAKFEPSMSLKEVAVIAEPLGLHPRILHHCRLHLSYHQGDPLFNAWHRFAVAGDLDGIRQHYSSLFAGAEAALEEAKKADPKATEIADPLLKSARGAINDPAGFLAVPPQPEFAFDEQTLAEYHRLSAEARILESGSPDASAAMGVSEGTVVATLPIHIRGSHRNLGEPIERRFPAVFPETGPVTFPVDHSGRLELARWMASVDHPLTARVYVNRVWRWHFGTGLVASTENFGALGDRPSHPELLDWLAHRFATSGWSTRDLHRLIMLSSTYQMASRHPDRRRPSRPTRRIAGCGSFRVVDWRLKRCAMRFWPSRGDWTTGWAGNPFRCGIGSSCLIIRRLITRSTTACGGPSTCR